MVEGFFWVVGWSRDVFDDPCHLKCGVSPPSLGSGRGSVSQEVLAVAAKFKCGNGIVCKTVVFNQPNLIWCSVSDAQFIFVF